MSALTDSGGYALSLLTTTELPVLALTMLGWCTQARGARRAALAALVVVDLSSLPLMVFSALLLAA